MFYIIQFCAVVNFFAENNGFGLLFSLFSLRFLLFSSVAVLFSQFLMDFVGSGFESFDPDPANYWSGSGSREMIQIPRIRIRKTEFTVWSVAPQTTLWEGPGPRFEPWPDIILSFKRIFWASIGIPGFLSRSRGIWREPELSLWPGSGSTLIFVEQFSQIK